MSVPAYELQMVAEQQRVDLHESISELRSHLRGRLGLKANLKQYVAAASGIAALTAGLLGYGIAGLFSNHDRSYKVVLRS